VDVSGQLAALTDLAESLGIVVRQGPPGGDSAGSRRPGGALVRLKGVEILFLDPSAAPEDHISVVAGALAGRAELADRFIPPAIRQLIEQAAADGD